MFILAVDQDKYKKESSQILQKLSFVTKLLAILLWSFIKNSRPELDSRFVKGLPSFSTKSIQESAASKITQQKG